MCRVETIEPARRSALRSSLCARIHPRKASTSVFRHIQVGKRWNGGSAPGRAGRWRT